MKERVKAVRAGKPPFFENGLVDLLRSGLKSGKLMPVQSLAEGVGAAELIFICVGTPPAADGRIDLSQLNSVCDALAPLLERADTRKIIAVRSTAVPGTTEALALRLSHSSSKKCPEDFGIVYNPEFLREGNALDDFLHANRVVIGTGHKADGVQLAELYEPFGRPVTVISLRAAEMAKYVSNSLIATEISFINEAGLIAREYGVDIGEVAEALDLRVGMGNGRLKAGCGFGGSCLQKDLLALSDAARRKGVRPLMLEAVLQTNDRMVVRMAELLEKRLGALEGKRVGILGVAFKAGTSDVRNSRAVPLAGGLGKRGAHVRASDPHAVLPGMEMVKDPQELVDWSDAVAILADWPEFASLGYGDKIVVDGRDTVPKRKRGKNYEGICWP
jgi:UDPglucose 6-dehydrogenase